MQTVINYAACDYLTLTSYDEGVHRVMLAAFNALQALSPSRLSKRLQYEGYQYEGIYYGAALQGGEVHRMLQASSFDAHRLLSWYQSLPTNADIARCTRIDIQLTVERERDDGSLYGYKTLIHEANKGATRGVPPNVTAYDKSGQWGETVYIGSRTSERFIRIYDKLYSDKYGIRFEVELKGSLARKVYFGALRSPTYLNTFLSSELARYNGIPLFSRMIDILGGKSDERIMIEQTPTTDESRLRWLEETVWPVVRKMYLANSQRERLRALISELDVMVRESPLDNLF